jgi:stage III sporulation protein AB
MWKLIGAVLIVSAGASFGFMQAMHLAKRPKQIRLIIGALQRLETEIMYGMTPLPDALRRISLQCAEPVAGLFRKAAQELAGQTVHSTNEIWQRAVEESWKRSSMKNGELETLRQLGFTLGLSDRIDQVKHLRLAASQLQTEEDLAREEQRRYEKMWRSLGVLAGALIAILLY